MEQSTTESETSLTHDYINLALFDDELIHHDPWHWKYLERAETTSQSQLRLLGFRGVIVFLTLLLN